MAVKVTRTRVCDVCGGEHGVTRYRITRLEGTVQRTATADVCEKPHGLVEALEAGQQARRGRKAGRPVVSLGEIVAKKTTTSKKPASKRTQASRKR